MPKIRDERRMHWFWINDVIVDEYGMKLGAYGLATYTILSRCANKEGRAIPSMRYMAKLLSVSTATIQKNLTLLETLGLIAREHRTTPKGGKANNDYLLLHVEATDVEESTPPPVSPGDTGVDQGQLALTLRNAAPPVSPGDTGVCHELPQGVSPGDTFGLLSIGLKDPEEKPPPPPASPPYAPEVAPEAAAVASPVEQPSKEAVEVLPPLTDVKLVGMWNEMAAAYQLTQVSVITPKRKKRLQKALATQPTWTFWQTVMQQFAESPGLLQGHFNGATGRGLTNNLDWLMSKGVDGVENYVKVFEGRYRDKAPPAKRCTTHKGAVAVAIGVFDCPRCGRIPEDQMEADRANARRQGALAYAAP